MNYCVNTKITGYFCPNGSCENSWRDAFPWWSQQPYLYFKYSKFAFYHSSMYVDDRVIPGTRASASPEYSRPPLILPEFPLNIILRIFLMIIHHCLDNDHSFIRDAFHASTSWFNWAPLTHWGRDKMDAISQTTFSCAFSWMKMYEFRLKFHWSLFPGVQLIKSHHWFR